MQKKRDANQSEIVSLFRQMGISVVDVTQGASVGFDCIISARGNTATIEIKSGPKKRLTPLEAEHSKAWPGKHAIVWDNASAVTVGMRLLSCERFPLAWRGNGW